MLGDAVHDFHFGLNVCRVPVVAANDVVDSGLGPTSDRRFDPSSFQDTFVVSEPLTREVLTRLFLKLKLVFGRAQQLGSEKGIPFENLVAFSLRSRPTGFCPCDFLDLNDEERIAFNDDPSIPNHWKQSIVFPARSFGEPTLVRCDSMAEVISGFQNRRLMRPPVTFGPDLVAPVMLQGGAQVLLSLRSKMWLSDPSSSDLNDAIETSSPFFKIDHLEKLRDGLVQKARQSTLKGNDAATKTHLPQVLSGVISQGECDQLSPRDKGTLTSSVTEIAALGQLKGCVGNVDSLGCLRLVIIASKKDVFGGERYRVSGKDLILFLGRGDVKKLVGGLWDTLWAGLLADEPKASSKRKGFDEQEEESPPKKVKMDDSS